MPRPHREICGRAHGGVSVVDAAGFAARGGGKFEAGVSRMEQETAPRGDSRHGAATGMDGGGIRPLSRATRKNNIDRIVLLDGFENFASAQARGKGVLFLTGHMSAWELAPFAQALFGYPLHFLVRAHRQSARGRADHAIPLPERESADRKKSVGARGAESAGGEWARWAFWPTTTRCSTEGVFVDFFGIPACTTAGLARFALHTSAAVVPGFLHWDARLAEIPALL